MTDLAELRRRATAAGVFLDFDDKPDEVGPAEFDPITGTYTTVSAPRLAAVTADEVEQLLVWLRDWAAARQQWEAERPERLAVHEDAWLETERAAQLSPNPAEAQEAWQRRAADWLAHSVHTRSPLPMLSRDRHEVAPVCQECGEVTEPHPVRHRCPPHPMDRYEPVPLLRPNPLGSGFRRLPVVRPLLGPPAGFELVRHSWCPRCDRATGDPLGRPVKRFRCEVVPPPPELEIGSRCHKEVFPVWKGYDEHARRRWYKSGRSRIWEDDGVKYFCVPCSARRLFRWGLRRARGIGVLRPKNSGLFDTMHQEAMSRLVLGNTATTDSNRSGAMGYALKSVGLGLNPLLETVRAHQDREHRRVQRLIAHHLPHDISDRELAEWLGHRAMVPPEVAFLMGLGDEHVGDWFT